MVSKMCRIASMIVLASLALSSAAWAATCSNASLSGTYGFLHGGTDAAGAPTTGFFAGAGPRKGATADGFGVKQGSPTCTNAGVAGSFGFEATGVVVAGAPVTGPVALIGELQLRVNTSGDGVISGEMAGSEDGTIFSFAEAPVTGSYSVATDCTGTATITPQGRSPLNFSFVVVDGGKEMLAIEMDADTVVSDTLVTAN